MKSFCVCGGTNPPYPQFYALKGGELNPKRLNPDFSAAYSARGGAYSGKGEYDKAIEDFNHAIQLDSGDCNAYYGRAGVYMAKEEYDRGIKDLETVLRINPNNFGARQTIEAARMMQKYKR